MLGTIRFIVGLVGIAWMAIAGGYAVYWFDRRPADVPTLPAFHFLWLTYQPKLPLSLAAQRDAAQGQYKSAVIAAASADKAVAGHIAAISADADTRIKAAQAVIRTRTITLIKEVPSVLTPATDRGFPLPVGLLRIHDAAAQGVALSAIPAPAGLADGSTGPVDASAFATVIASNYGVCLANAGRLSALQAWVSAVRQASLNSSEAPPDSTVGNSTQAPKAVGVN